MEGKKEAGKRKGLAENIKGVTQQESAANPFVLGVLYRKQNFHTATVTQWANGQANKRIKSRNNMKKAVLNEKRCEHSAIDIQF